LASAHALHLPTIEVEYFIQSWELKSKVQASSVVHWSSVLELSLRFECQIRCEHRTSTKLEFLHLGLEVISQSSEVMTKVRVDCSIGG